MRLAVGQRTDVGRMREGNEDGLVVDDSMGLFAVADGMGGHQAGEVASGVALEALRAAVASGKPIRDAITDANEAVIERSAGDDRLRGMGTTITAGTLAAGGTLIVGHVGDSRAYLARDGQLEQITEDHSLVEEMVRGGELTPEQAETHPQRSIITRALGIDPEIEVDVYPVELREGDRLLLCSDGLTTMVRVEAIRDILQREESAQQTADRLVDAANAAGGEDNITALVLDVVPDTEGVPPTRAPTERERRKEVEAAARPPRRRGRVGRLVRIALWVIPVLIILGLAFGAVGWYARRTYYVELARGECRLPPAATTTTVTPDPTATATPPPTTTPLDDVRCVTVFKGVQGGLLGWDPTLEEHTDIAETLLTPAERNDLEGGKRFSSRGKADAYVDRLRDEIEQREDPAPPTTLQPTPPPS